MTADFELRTHAIALPSVQADTRTSLCAMDALPQELLDHIIDELGSDADTLKCCSLTSNRLLAQSTARLFAPCHIYLSKWEPERLHTLQTSARIRGSLTRLTLYALSFEHWSVVRDLPRLRELTVSNYDPPAEDDVAAWLQKPRSAERPIDSLEVFGVPLHAAAWILRLFVSVKQLRLRYIEADRAVPIASAPHAVTHLDIKHVDTSTWRYLARTVSHAALEGLTVDVSGPFIAGDGHESVLDDVVRAVGARLRSYHHADLASRRPAPHPPVLSACAQLSSVVLHTDAFWRGRSPDAWSRLFAFLASLPPSVLRLVLVLDSGHIDDNETLVAELAQVDWPEICRALEPCSHLEILEVSAISRVVGPTFMPLPDHSIAKNTILGGLSERLKQIIRFV